MKFKSWLKYLTYIILILVIIVLKDYVESIFSDSYKRFDSDMFFYLVISLILGVFIGALLGLDHYLSEIKKEGIWKINLPKLVLVGMPSLYFSLTNIWFLSEIKYLRDIISYPLLFIFRYGSGYISLFQVILGYVLITSFFKYNHKM